MVKRRVIKFAPFISLIYIALATAAFLLQRHALLDEEARSAGRNRAYASTPEMRARIMRLLDKDIRKLRKRGSLPPQAIDQYMEMIVDGQLNQLYNIPLDMVIGRQAQEERAAGLRVHGLLPRHRL